MLDRNCTKDKPFSDSEGERIRSESYKVHPAASAFPMLSQSAFEALLGDVEANGLNEPIVMWRDHWRDVLWLIDGRNRARVLKTMGLDPLANAQFKSFDDDVEVARYVVSVNLHRRHMNESQRAMVAARLLPIFEAEAKARQGARTDIRANLHECSPASRSDESAGAVFNVGQRSVASAKKVASEGAPEVVEAVKCGELAVSAAAKLVKEDADTQLEVLRKVEAGEAKNVPQALRQLEDERRAQVEVPDSPLFEVFCAGALASVNGLDRDIHCVIADPPYGLDTHRSREGGQDYADGKAYALEVLNTVCEALFWSNRLASDAHLYFFSGYTLLGDFKRIIANHFEVQDNPIVWVKSRHTMADFAAKYPNKHEYVIFAKARS